MHVTKHTKGVLALVFLSFGFGLIAITVRYLSGHYTLFQQLYISIGAGFILSFFVFPRSLSFERIKKIPSRDWFIMVFRVVVGYLIAASLYRESLTLTKISNVTFIQSVPFVALFGWFIFKEKFTFKKLLYVVLAYIGVIIISMHDTSFSFTLGKGELFSFISSVMFSISYIARKWMTNYLNDKEITQILLFLATILFILLSVVTRETAPIFEWQWLLVLAIFLTGALNVCNIYLVNYGFANVRPVLASNILTLESFFALFLALIFYREIPSLREFIGGIIIVVAVIQMNRVEEQSKG